MSDNKTFHNGSYIDHTDVSGLLTQARDAARALVVDFANDAEKQSERAHALSQLGNLPPGIATSLETISKTLWDEVLKIRQQLEKTTPKNTAAPVPKAA